MVIEAAGLALLAALTPTALLVAAAFLGTENPRRIAGLYLIGATAMTAVMATVVFVVLHAGHLDQPHERDPRYGLRLGLGVALLLVGAYCLRRGNKPPDPAKAAGKKKGPGLMARLIAAPGPKEAFFVGILVYSPSLTFVAAVQTVATSRESLAESVAILVVIVVITLLLVWLPLLLFLLMPDRTGRTLRSFNSWLRSHGYQILVVALFGASVLLTIDGIAGLVTKG